MSATTHSEGAGTKKQITQAEQDAKYASYDIGLAALQRTSAVVEQATEYNTAAVLGSGMLSGLRDGLGSAFAAKTLLAAGFAGPVGWGVGLISAGAALWSGFSKKKEAERQKAALEKKWKASVKQYKAGLNKTKTEVSKEKSKLSKEQGRATLSDIVGKEIAAYNRLMSGGAVDETTKRLRAQTKELGLAELEERERNYEQKLTLLSEVADLLDKERGAHREIDDGSLQKKYIHRADAKMEELRELDI